MNIKEIFDFNGSFFRVKIENEKQKSQTKDNVNHNMNRKKEYFSELKKEWEQEYHLIYLSYILEK